MKNKTAAVYSDRLKHTPVSVMDGLRSIGFNVKHRGATAYRAGETEQFDVVFVSGLHGQARQVVADYEKKNVPVIVHDLGRVRKDLNHVYLGIGGLHWLPKGKADDKRLKKILFTGTQERPEGKHVLIVGQKGNDQSHQLSNDDLDKLYNALIVEIKKHTDLPIIFRPHPLRSYNQKISGAEVVTPEQESLHEALDGAVAAVMHSSTSGLTALELGVPVFCEKGSFLEPIASGLLDDLSSIEDPATPDDKDVKNFFQRVSYTQWSVREIVSGAAIKYIVGQIGIETEDCAISDDEDTQETPEEASGTETNDEESKDANDSEKQTEESPEGADGAADSDVDQDNTSKDDIPDENAAAGEPESTPSGLQADDDEDGDTGGDQPDRAKEVPPVAKTQQAPGAVINIKKPKPKKPKAKKPKGGNNAAKR